MKDTIAKKKAAFKDLCKFSSEENKIHENGLTIKLGKLVL